MSSASAHPAVSARAQAIIDAAEDAARQRLGGARAGARTRPLPAAVRRIPVAAPTLPPRRTVTPGVAAPTPLPPARARRDVAPTREELARLLTDVPGPARLLALVEHVTTQTAEARRRLDALAEAIDRLESQVSIDGEPYVAPVPEVGTEPEVALVTPEPDAPAPGDAPVAQGQPLPPAVPPTGATPLPRQVGGFQGAPAKGRDHGAGAPSSATPSSPPNDTARLVAIEMAVGGATRQEVGTRLRDEFGIRNADDVLDDVFGGGSAADSRMPWG